MLVFYLILDIKVVEGHKIIVIVTLPRCMNWAALDRKYILLKYQLGKVGVSSNKKNLKPIDDILSPTTINDLDKKVM